jgi:hypothetical protein
MSPTRRESQLFIPLVEVSRRLPASASPALHIQSAFFIFPAHARHTPPPMWVVSITLGVVEGPHAGTRVVVHPPLRRVRPPGTQGAGQPPIAAAASTTPSFESQAVVVGRAPREALCLQLAADKELSARHFGITAKWWRGRRQGAGPVGSAAGVGPGAGPEVACAGAAAVGPREDGVAPGVDRLLLSLTDLGSTNGTVVDGVVASRGAVVGDKGPHPPLPLVVGSRVVVGKTVVVVEGAEVVRGVCGPSSSPAIALDTDSGSDGEVGVEAAGAMGGAGRGRDYAPPPSPCHPCPAAAPPSEPGPGPGPGPDPVSAVMVLDEDSEVQEAGMVQVARGVHGAGEAREACAVEAAQPPRVPRRNGQDCERGGRGRSQADVGRSADEEGALKAPPQGPVIDKDRSGVLSLAALTHPCILLSPRQHHLMGAALSSPSSQPSPCPCLPFPHSCS